MAEGWAKHLGNHALFIQSAGIESHGKNPRAIEVMSEAGVDISAQESTMLTEDMLLNADVVVTVCSHADGHCPTLPNRVQKIHWPLEDPAKARGTNEEVLQIFRDSREEIRARVTDLVKNLGLL